MTKRMQCPSPPGALCSHSDLGQDTLSLLLSIRSTQEKLVTRLKNCQPGHQASTKQSVKIDLTWLFMSGNISTVLLDFSLTVKAVPHECVIKTSQP